MAEQQLDDFVFISKYFHSTVSYTISICIEKLIFHHNDVEVPTYLTILGRNDNAKNVTIIDRFTPDELRKLMRKTTIS